MFFTTHFLLDDYRIQFGASAGGDRWRQCRVKCDQIPTCLRDLKYHLISCIACKIIAYVLQIWKQASMKAITQASELVAHVCVRLKSKHILCLKVRGCSSAGAIPLKCHSQSLYAFISLSFKALLSLLFSLRTHTTFTFLCSPLSDLAICFPETHYLRLSSLCPTFWGTSEDRAHLWLGDWITVAVPVEKTPTQPYANTHTHTHSGWLCRGLKMQRDEPETDS